MSTNADVIRGSDMTETPLQGATPPGAEACCRTSDWNPANFAREQIRGLVRRVFFANGAHPIRQVIFSATEMHTDVASICDQVGRELALETHADVAIVGPERRVRQMTTSYPHQVRSAAIKSWSVQIRSNLWFVPDPGLRGFGQESGSTRYWLSCLADLRHEFEYAVIQGPVAGISSDAALLGKLADGIILVLEAHSTRKATARTIKAMLEGAQSRILGTVLSERTFPVPERIYRRL
jgi:hypothetical protein